MKRLKRKSALILWLASMAAVSFAATVHVGYTRIANTSQEMPGAGHKFTSFGMPSISDDHVLFSASAGFSDHAIFENVHDYLELVADNSTEAPSTGGTFSQFYFPNALPEVNGHQTTFYAQTEENKGLYTFQGGRLGVIVDSKAPMPGSKNSFSNFSHPWLLDNGVTVFLAHDQDNYGVYKSEQGHLEILMNASSTTIPHGKGMFTRLTDLAVSPAGPDDSYALIAQGANKQYGVYFTQQFRLDKIADENTKMPGSLGFFSAFRSLSMDAGQIVFIGTGILGQEGIYDDDGRTLKKAVDVESNVPESEGKFTHFSTAITRHGWIIFHGDGEFNAKGLYLYTAQYGLFKLLSSGDQINGKTVIDADIGAKSLQGNNLAMVLHFKDGSEGVYVATINISAY